MKNKRFVLAFILIILMNPFSVAAQEKISVAVAANFISAFKEIAADFEEKTGVKVEATFSSTGNLYNQIKNGAPYDLFLSADLERPDILLKEGWTEGSFVYARGKVILWSADKKFCRAVTWHEALKTGKIKKIAIANPLTAPYGAAAKEALIKSKLWDNLQDKMVIAQSIAQSFQYASTASVDAGFCALSASVNPEGLKGCFYALPEAPDVVQAACVAKNAKNKQGAELFAGYLLSEHALKIKQKYGYR
ncbi:MAG: molybdate ABC transporter substrate-binding protein [Deltaproteobacteria bacterium HGW-Deltaproteobacteria-1]|nr:MAG: molybdate ABC transporter substrate-binding protein [Deltaproteobacteria bacterium HGW-Deltaproteobacteria-1]